MPRNIFYYNLNKERFYLTLKCGQIVGSKLKFENKKKFPQKLFFSTFKGKIDPVGVKFKFAPDFMVLY